VSAAIHAAALFLTVFGMRSRRVRALLEQQRDDVGKAARRRRHERSEAAALRRVGLRVRVRALVGD
jgi:hypothetical protein